MWCSESNCSGGSRLSRPPDLNPRHRDCSSPLPLVSTHAQRGPALQLSQGYLAAPYCGRQTVSLLNCWRLRFASQKIKAVPPSNYGQWNPKLWEEGWWLHPPLSMWVNCSLLSSFGHMWTWTYFSTHAMVSFLFQVAWAGRLDTSILRELVFFTYSFSQETYCFKPYN